MKKKKIVKKTWTKPTIQSLKFNKTLGGDPGGISEDHFYSPGIAS